jgi:trehalose 6-phosphate synthase/phosphatase
MPSSQGLSGAVHSVAPLRLLLDYDGTLVPIAPSPELAAPDHDVLGLLDTLARMPALRVDLVSGRTRAALEGWFGHLPVSLWAEHGYWHRSAPGDCWQSAADVPPDFIHDIEPVFEHFAASTPGSHVERKTASIAWHFRRADRISGARQARRLRRELQELLRCRPLEVVDGRKVIEVRLSGVSKALVAERVHAESVDGRHIMAFGDDRTDEDLFRALPASSATVVVGDRRSCARFRAADYREVRHLLRSLTNGTRSSITLQRNTEFDGTVQGAG